MSIFKRTFTSLYASIDQMVGEIENHDALIDAAIKEQKKKIAAARVQLRRVEASEKRIDDQLAQLCINAKLWTQRAAVEAKDQANEQQALMCLQRRQKVQQKIEKLQLMKDEYRHSTDRMQQDISQCEQDLTAMTQKHQMMRARQSTSDAMQIVERDSGIGLETIENSFDRWEVKISQSELTVDRLDNGVDFIEQEYLQEENEQQLRFELAQLLLQDKTVSDAQDQGEAS